MSKLMDSIIKLEVSEIVKEKMLNLYGYTVKYAYIKIEKKDLFEKNEALIKSICEQWAQNRTINKTGRIAETDLLIYMGNNHISFLSVETGDRICMFTMVCDSGYDTI